MTESNSTAATPYFDEASSDWDQNPLVLDLARSAVDNLTRYLNPEAGQIVMEYGCGTGLIAESIVPKVDCVHAWDSSPGMLAVLEAKIRQRPALPILPRLIDLLAAPIPAERFDLIYSNMALHHIEDTSRLFDVLRQLTVPGGRVALIDLDTEDGSFHGSREGIHHLGFERDEVARQLEAAGFTDVEVLLSVQE